MNEAKVKQTI